MICPKCGYKNSDDNRFCVKCDSNTYPETPVAVNDRAASSNKTKSPVKRKRALSKEKIVVISASIALIVRLAFFLYNIDWESSDEALISCITDADIYLGMTSNEMLEVIGSDYDELITHDDNAFPDGRTCYNYVVNNIPALDCRMPSVMFFEFSEQDKLYNFGYHIGCDLDIYYFPESILLEEYVKINNLLKNEHNLSLNYIDEYSDKNIICANSARSEDDSDSNEEILLVVSAVDSGMWVGNGMSEEITISCYDKSLINFDD